MGWINRFIRHHGNRHPEMLGEREIEQFLTHLAVHGNVAASTQNQAMNALVFLYRQVLGRKLDDSINAMRAKKPKRVPVVLTHEEVTQLLACLRGVYLLIAQLLYGAGLRVIESLRLRVKDVDFARMEITVHEGKGMKDRVTMLPVCVARELRAHIESVQAVHKSDLARGFGEVYLPFALARKYPRAPREWQWQYVFPASDISVDPRSCTRFVIRSQLASSRRARTSGKSRNCLGTRASRRR